MARRLVNLRETVAFYLVLAVFGILCLAWSLPAAALSWAVPRTHRARTGQAAIRAGFRLHLWLMRVSGLARFDLDALDALDAGLPLVIVANHRSLLDAVLVISRLPRVVCITKAGLWDNAFFGGGIRMAGYLRNDAPLRLVRSAQAALAGGQHLLVFPEGTRSADGELAAFRPGFVLMANAASVPIQTVILESNSAYLRRGWSLFRKPAFPLRYTARLGPRLAPGGQPAATAARVEACLRAELANPAPWPAAAL